MPRLTILAKGNGDVRDSLYALHENGAVKWNGINAILRDRHPRWTARVIHETMTRSDAVLEGASTPPALSGRALPLGPYPVSGQFQTRLFDSGADVVVLSLQPEVTNRLVRHRAERHLLYPYNDALWPAHHRRWLAEHYAPEALLDPSQSMGCLADIVARIRQRHDPYILIYNLSPIVPWERLHCYECVDETLAERIRRFNLGLIGLSRATGISIVDVESVVARAGADRLKLDALSLNAEGCRLVTQEVLRILEDLGCFSLAEAA